MASTAAGGSTGLDCRTLRQFAGDMTFLSVSDISSMPPSEFEDCLEEFQKSSLSSDQYTAVGGKLKQVHNKIYNTNKSKTTAVRFTLIQS